MTALRRFLSILLLAAFGLPFASPLFALAGASDANVLECCRRNGKHHCQFATGNGAGVSAWETQLSAPAEKCPYCPRALTASHLRLLAPGISSPILASLASYPAVHAQPESRHRITRDRALQERGPPAFITL